MIFLFKWVIWMFHVNFRGVSFVVGFFVIQNLGDRFNEFVVSRWFWENDPIWQAFLTTLGGGFKYFWFSPRSLGKWSNLTCAYVSNGCQEPAASFCFVFCQSLGPKMCFCCRFVGRKDKNPMWKETPPRTTPSDNSLSPIIMVQWKMAFVRKRSNWRYTHFSLNHGRNQKNGFSNGLWIQHWKVATVDSLPWLWEELYFFNTSAASKHQEAPFFYHENPWLQRGDLEASDGGSTTNLPNALRGELEFVYLHLS